MSLPWPFLFCRTFGTLPLRKRIEHTSIIRVLPSGHAGARRNCGSVLFLDVHEADCGRVEYLNGIENSVVRTTYDVNLPVDRFGGQIIARQPQVSDYTPII